MSVLSVCQGPDLSLVTNRLAMRTFLKLVLSRAKMAAILVALKLKLNLIVLLYLIFILISLKVDLTSAESRGTLFETPLSQYCRILKCTNYSLRNSVCFYPRIFTERLKSTFVNRLIFKYNLV